MNFVNGNYGAPGMNANFGGALPYSFMPGQMGGDPMGGNGMGQCCPGYNVNIPPQMQQIAQQMQQCQMLMGFIMGMMAGMMAGQNGGMMPGMGMPGMGMPGMGMPGGGFGMPGGGGYGMPGGGYGNPGGGYGMPGGGYGNPGGGYGGAGDAGSCSSGNGVVPPGNYSGPINLQRVIAAVPAGSRQAASQHFPGILSECQRQGVTSKPQIAYILATTIRESGAGAHMNEFASGNAYEGRRDLGNTRPGDGPRFKGRGYVQITGRNNYQNWSRKLGIDLVNNPQLATQPATAARILVQGMKEGSFTGKKLGDYIGENGGDFNNARRVVNGTDHAGEIAGVAQRLLAAMG
jgi:predicted chitinase